jgi:hypothetical protein
VIGLRGYSASATPSPFHPEIETIHFLIVSSLDRQCLNDAVSKLSSALDSLMAEMTARTSAYRPTGLKNIETPGGWWTAALVAA